jgi:quinol monooxygenase YgiN
MTGVLIRARVDPEQRRELMSIFKEISQSTELPANCLERRVYEEIILPTNLLVVEEWSDMSAMHSYLSSSRFQALIGVVKVLDTVVDVRTFETACIQI